MLQFRAVVAESHSKHIIQVLLRSEFHGFFFYVLFSNLTRGCIWANLFTEFCLSICFRLKRMNKSAWVFIHKNLSAKTTKNSQQGSSDENRGCPGFLCVSVGDSWGCPSATWTIGKYVHVHELSVSVGVSGRVGQRRGGQSYILKWCSGAKCDIEVIKKFIVNKKNVEIKQCILTEKVIIILALLCCIKLNCVKSKYFTKSLCLVGLNKW